MNRALSIPLVLLLLSAAPACGFYFGDDDDPCDEDFGGGDSAQVPVEDTGLLNPETGQCEFFGTVFPPFPCDSECGPCPGGGDAERPDAVAQPSWGFCESFCTGLDETTCLATAGCRAGYVDGGTGPDVYNACWMTDQTGPVQGGNCAGLDAQSCSTHDDCIAIHANACAGDSNSDPLPPDGLVETCLGVFSECAGESNSADPGTCYGEVLCDGPVPECPPDTLPGVKDGCYTGFCIPVAQCESQPACAAIAAEMACVGRSDCTPLYEGIDCTCDAAGCTCNDWQFESCTANSP